MISESLNIYEFLNSLGDDMERSEMIRKASRERRETTELVVQRGSGAKAQYQKIQRYGGYLGEFLQFLYTSTGDHEIPLPQEFLNRIKARATDFD